MHRAKDYTVEDVIKKYKSLKRVNSVGIFDSYGEGDILDNLIELFGESGKVPVHRFYTFIDILDTAYSCGWHDGYASGHEDAEDCR